MATKKPMKKFKRYDEGGSVEEAMAKKRGLDISNKEAPVGFFERLRAGNIDEPGSEAYNRFGAGRGRDRGESVSVNQPMPAAPSMPAASSRPLSDDMYSDFGPSAGRSSSETITPTRPTATKPVVPAKPAATPVPPLRNTGPDRSSLINKPPAYAGPLRGMRSDAGTSPPIATHFGPRDEEKAANKMNIPKMRDDAKAALAEDPSALMPGAGAAAAAAALLAKTKLGKLGKMFKGAKKSTGKDLVVSPSKGTGYSPGRADDERAAKAREKLMKSSFIKKQGDDVTDVTAKKRGGAVKKYASGGMVSSASRRADGIATKGKTRCKIC
jgi:hypothetical protein